jgi:hypothetical protein
MVMVFQDPFRLCAEDISQETVLKTKTIASQIVLNAGQAVFSNFSERVGV